MMSAIGLLPGDPDGFTPSGVPAPEGPPPPQYPEHDRMTALRSKIDVVTDFLEWLGSKDYVIAEWLGAELVEPDRRGVEAWLAAYFEIDPKKIEREKRAMLDELRRMNEVGP